MDSGHALGKDSHCDWRWHARPLPTHLVIKQQRSSLSLSLFLLLSLYLRLLRVCCACALATVACHKCAIKLCLIPVRTWTGGLAAAEDATVVVASPHQLSCWRELSLVQLLLFNFSICSFIIIALISLMLLSATSPASSSSSSCRSLALSCALRFAVGMQEFKYPHTHAQTYAHSVTTL